MTLFRHPFRATAVLALASLAQAQWTANTAVNTPVCVQPGDQAVPRTAATGDGKTWIGWFDHRGGNYDVYVQLLDEGGNALLAPDGLLVSSHPQNTSLVDWDLIADSDGNCVCTFTDIRAGGDLDVYAYRISAGGAFLWGANGVALSNNSDFEPNPTVAELVDGTFVFVWSVNPSTGSGSIVAQRLDAGGNPLLGPTAVTLATGTAAGEKPGFCDVVASDGGNFIVMWLRNTAVFTSPRHIKAQKYDTAGNALWTGGVPVSVFDSSSVPIAYQPILQSDASGGAVFCWHRSATLFDCFVQRVDASGVEVFAHNGLQVSLEANRHKLDPSLASYPASGDLVVVFDRRDSGQGNRGVGAQRISAAGARLWGNDGIELEAVDSVNEGFERVVPLGSGAIVAYFQYPTFGSSNSNILARRLDESGATVWGPLAISTNLVPKDKPRLVSDASGVARMVWDDERADSGDIYAQDVFADGTVGPFATPLAYCTAKQNSLACTPAIAGFGFPSATEDSGFTISAIDAINNKIGFLLYRNSLAGSGQGAVPFTGGTLCFSGSPNRTTPVLTGGTPAPINDCSGVFAIDMNSFAQGAIAGPPFPQAYLLINGQEVCAQYWGRDPGFAPPNNTQLTDGLIWTIGP